MTGGVKYVRIKVPGLRFLGKTDPIRGLPAPLGLSKNKYDCTQK